MISVEDAAALLAMADEWEQNHYAWAWGEAAAQLRSKVVTLGEPPTIDRV